MRLVWIFLWMYGGILFQVWAKLNLWVCMTLGVKGHWRAKQSETSEWQKGIMQVV